MAVTLRTLRLQADLAAQLAKVNDQQVRDLVSAWVDAWDEVAPDLTAALLEQLVAGDRVTRAQLLRSTRLRKALAVIADNLQQLAKEAGVRLTGDLQAVIATAGAAQASVVDSQLPPNAPQLINIDAWSRVDPLQVTAIVTRTTEQITSLLKPLAPETYTVVRRELIRGVASGSNPRETARRMVARAEKQFNGKLGLNRALVIARTETIDAHREAAELGMAQHADVLAGWDWLAKLDTRTCRSCWGQHGRRHPLSEPGPIDHQCGRCGRLAVTKSWAELGFPDIEEPPSLLPNAAERFNALPAADQAKILGPSGHKAWVGGRFPMDAWSVRRTTDGWRDSFGVAPVPQSGGRSSRSAA